MGKEIERKFLLHEFPISFIQKGILKVKSVKKIDQTYIKTGEEEERVRKVVDITDSNSPVTSYTHTFKKGKGIVREENEFFISLDEYESIILQSQKKPLKKVRTNLFYENIILEVDEYEDFDFVIAEIEFKDEKEANDFKMPNWFKEEVTGIDKYKNPVLWKQVQD